MATISTAGGAGMSFLPANFQCRCSGGANTDFLCSGTNCLHRQRRRHLCPAFVGSGLGLLQRLALLRRDQGSKFGCKGRCRGIISQFQDGNRASNNVLDRPSPIQCRPIPLRTSIRSIWKNHFGNHNLLGPPPIDSPPV